MVPYGRDWQWPVYVDSGRSASKIFYAETFATTIRAISGLSRQTPSVRMTKSAGSENVSLDEIQHGAINVLPFRLH
jgi:hypothetical protein